MAGARAGTKRSSGSRRGVILRYCPGVEAVLGVPGPLAVVVVGGSTTYWTQRLADSRREAREAVQAVAQLYDTAIAAVSEVQAARWAGGITIHGDYLRAVSPEEIGR